MSLSSTLSSSLSIASTALNAPIEKNPHSEKQTFPACEACGSPSIYSCPACSTRSCSLTCVKAHKTQRNCSGKTSPFETNVAFRNYSEATLLKDFQFLERSSRLIESSARLFCRHAVERSFTSYRRCSVSGLRRICEQRRIDLRVCPGELERRRVNTTVISKNKIFWRIQWKFIGVQQTYVDSKICEENTLETLLQRFLKNRWKGGITKHDLMEYRQAGIEKVHILYQDTPLSPPRYYYLNLKMKLRDCLIGKTVIEFPEFSVVLSTELHQFIILPQVVKVEQAIEQYSSEEEKKAQHWNCQHSSQATEVS
ncbi:HIT zinc finger protein [Cardiosporidium cionae]|uniref:HIT zinc finger protein n=1 Tax=Cardiosporidium cionae TaxID=476202 RepID=A0ABQ7JA04_9APIC|nr:HIT zinc finger protein [Cardiosporidium cionae]|eukprot:KAF8820785.1 HIT zinc finger protein [Cardiosporidium cionae]